MNTSLIELFLLFAFLCVILFAGQYLFSVVNNSDADDEGSDWDNPIVDRDDPQF